MSTAEIYSDIQKKLISFSPEQLRKAQEMIDLISKEESKESFLSGKRQAGTLKGKIFMADDFDEPLDDFKDYM